MLVHNKGMKGRDELSKFIPNVMEFPWIVIESPKATGINFRVMPAEKDHRKSLGYIFKEPGIFVDLVPYLSMLRYLSYFMASGGISKQPK